MATRPLSTAAAALAGVLGVSAPARADTERSQPFDIAVTIGVGVGTAAMGRFSDGVRDYMAELEQTNDQFRFDDDLAGHVSWSVAPRVRLYLPHHTLIETGPGVLLNGGSAALQVGDLDGEMSYRNRVIELPLLVGIHWPVGSRFQIHGAVGPTILFAARSTWRYDLGRVSSFEAGGGGGGEVAIGGDLFVHRHISMSVAARYRFAITGELEVAGDSFPPVQPVEELDFSGIFVELGATWHVR